MELINSFKDFFEDKKIFITGHTGFIGSWLSIWLIELGANVFGYALPPRTNEDNFVKANLKERIQNYYGDIRDYKNLKNIFRTSKADIIFHLAAQPIVRKSYKVPKETYDINVGGTVNVFELFRKIDTCKLLINFTSDKCYENREFVGGYKEDDRLFGYDPYSSSKTCSELVTHAYISSFFNPDKFNNQKSISSVRSGNIIGGGDWQEDRLIPDCMRAIKRNESLCIRNPTAVRPWIYVLEPICGFLTLTIKMWENKNKFMGSWNFGSDKDSIYNVEEVIKKIINYIGRGKYLIQKSKEDEKLHETNLLILNCLKSKHYLQWEPLLNIDDTIKLTCDWYIEEEVNYDFDVNQINTYLEFLKK